MTATRRELTAERQAALEQKDYERFHELTRRIAELPMPGVGPLTQTDIDRFNAAHGGRRKRS